MVRIETQYLQVVEDELSSSTIKENDLVELKQKLQDVKASIVDETDEDKILSNVIDAQVQYKTHAKVYCLPIKSI